MPFRGFALAVASLLLAGPALAQLSMDRRLADSLRVAANPNDTTGWRFSALNSLNATQVSFVNWAAGGENSFALAAIGNYQAHYHRRRNAWDNILDVAYGIQKQGENPFRKNEDRLDVLSKYAYLLRDNLRVQEMGRALHPGRAQQICLPAARQLWPKLAGQLSLAVRQRL